MVRRRHHFRFFLYRIKFCTLFSSSLLRKVFAKADLEGRKFRIIIADGRPKFEGKEMARQLTSLGLHCTYVLVSSVPYIMQEVSFIFIQSTPDLVNFLVSSKMFTKSGLFTIFTVILLHNSNKVVSSS